MDAIILAGGKGSRMDNEIPKPLVSAKNKPILAHQIDYLFGCGKVKKIILALGYKSDMIIDFIKRNYAGKNIDFSIETEELGTAGSLRLAIQKTSSEFILVLNCDDISDIDILKLSSIKDNVICIAHPRLPFGLVEPRFGTVSFKEKPVMKDWVSCGWYMFNKNKIQKALPKKGSLEYDVFPKISLKVYKHVGSWHPLNTQKDISDFENIKKGKIF